MASATFFFNAKLRNDTKGSTLYYFNFFNAQSGDLDWYNYLEIYSGVAYQLTLHLHFTSLMLQIIRRKDFSKFYAWIVNVEASFCS